MDDFSSGTSSRSTKLIHGGVRYLLAAAAKFDIEQVRSVMFPDFTSNLADFYAVAKFEFEFSLVLLVTDQKL